MIKVDAMNVYLSVGDLDIRNASGMELPVVREADNDWYSSGPLPSLWSRPCSLNLLKKISEGQWSKVAGFSFNSL